MAQVHDFFAGSPNSKVDPVSVKKTSYKKKVRRKQSLSTAFRSPCVSDVRKFNHFKAVHFCIQDGQSQSDSNPFITNLTVVDLLLCCTALPLTLVLVLGSRSQKAMLCFFHEASISFSSCTSAISLLVISFDR